MKDLKDIRLEINKIDKEMASLFAKRMELVKNVANYKKEHALPILDVARENEVIQKNMENFEDETLKKYYHLYLQEMMSISKKYQEYLNQGMKIAYAGEVGAFAFAACTRIFKDATYVGFKTFKDAYVALEKGEVDSAVLPIENSFAGDVGNVMDLIFSGNLYINQIYDLEVVHNLVAKKGVKLENVKTVISHPQALSQCMDYIKKHNFTTVEESNTASAAKKLLSLDDSFAAIASDAAAKFFDLEIIDHHINTSLTNTTRFAVFSKSIFLPNPLNKMGEHFILVFTVLNEAGALAKTLNIIGSHNFNMRNLRSRPLKGLMWNYYFFVELEGNINTQEGEQMMRELSTVCDRLKLVGTYKTN